MNKKIPKKNIRPVSKTKYRFFALICLVIGGSLLMMNATVAGKIAALFSVKAQSEETEHPTNGDGRISPEALRQIESLVKEKESRTPAEQKIDSNLLYQIKMQRGQRISDEVAVLETGLQVDQKNFIEVDVTANVSKRLLRRLNEINAEIVVVLPQYRSITGNVPLTEIESLAALDEVIFIQPRMRAVTNQSRKSVTNAELFGSSIKPLIAPSFSGSRAERARNVRRYLATALPDDLPRPNIGSQTAEGDTTHRSNVARNSYGVNGAGIKIGVLSDGVNTLAARQATGDLPTGANMVVLPGQAGSGDEGTAMLEIVYDAAPGAQLYFATAFTSITSFAQNIKDLRTAGCDIIIDDVSYFVESPFQDGQAPSVVSNTNGGIVTQAVNDVTTGSQAGALYFSSAGNSGNKNDNTSGVWEGDFADGGAAGAPVTTVGNLHDFDPGAGITAFNTITTTGSVGSLVWSDPLGGSNNDYDLFRLNSTGTTIQGSSTNIQSGTQDPIEQVSATSSGQRLVIVKKTAAANRFLHLNTNRGRLTFNTPGVIYGHNGAKNTISVGATPAGPAVFSVVAGPFPNPHTAANLVEIFSSDGPRRNFYNANGSAITPGNVSATGGQALQKPDITAADGVTTTTPGFIPFFGTSAAAPQAGAMMALLKQAKPTATNTQLYNAMTSTAIDIETAGTDRDAGFGIFMPIPALVALGVQPIANLQTGTVTAAEAPGNANGRIEPGETASLNVQLSNVGAANATTISANLTTATAGVTIIIPRRNYADIAPSASGTNATPWQFVLGSGFPCGGTINFTLTVNYTGGAAASQTFNFSVNTAGVVNSFSENFDGAAAPALPAGWTTARTGTTPPALFATTATTPDTAPNAAFTNGSATVASNSLISPAIVLPASQPNFQLSFRQTRNFEGTTAANSSFDGGILELSTDGGTTYNNVTSATVGGSFTTGGYNCTINNGFSNPVGGQAGWCSVQTAYATSTLNLPGTLSGQTIRLRWRAGWDNSTANADPNWRIDTITLTRPAACSAFTSTTTGIVSDAPDPSSVGQNFTVIYSIVPAFAETSFGGSPTGNVTVTDGVESCTGTVAAGQCVLALTTPGNRTLRAFYTGNGVFAATISNGNSHQVNVVTAADSSVGGRVLTSNDRGVANATITMTAPNGNIRTARTNYLGYYNFNAVESGQSYIFQVTSKGLEFLPQIVTVNQTLTELNFVAQN